MSKADIALVMLSLVFTLSCRTATGVATDSDLSIVGGSLVRSNERFARHSVALVDTDEVDGYCTGVLIAPDIVLTAAHCFRHKHKNSALYFSTKLPDVVKTNDPNRVTMKKVLTHPDFDLKALDRFDKSIAKIVDSSKVKLPTNAFNDLALIYFDAKLPKGYEPIPLSKVEPTVEALITTAGYGCLSTVCDELANRLRKVDMNFVRIEKKSNLILLSAGKNKGACPGDSGGPDFIEASQETGKGLELLAIVDTGPESCESGISIDTLIEPYRDWILSSSETLRQSATNQE